MRLTVKKIDMQFQFRYFVCIILALYISTVVSFSQVNENQVRAANKDSFAEEMFSSTDRDVYIAGEQVMIKLFCLNRLTHQPSRMSKVAYVSLVDAANNQLVQVKIMLDGFTGYGQINLPDTMRTGNYFICSCTHWMQNFSPELYSYKTISVINPFQRIEQIKVPDKVIYPDTMMFFPEGGSIISGCETTIGFRCLDRKRNPVEFNGSVVDAGNNPLCEVRSDKSGCGFFKITPTTPGIISLVSSNEKGPHKKFDLPLVVDTGITFSLGPNDNPAELRFLIHKGDAFNASWNEFYFVYTPVSFTPFVKQINAIKEKEIVLQKSSLPEGLAKISIEDEKGVVYAERWFYNEKKTPLDCSMKPERDSYYEREKVRIEIACSDAEGRPVEGNMMISVARSFSINDQSDKIIQSPSLNFQVTNASIEDLNSKLIFFRGSDKMPRVNTTEPGMEYIPEPEGHIISGVIRNISDGKPLAGENMVLSFVGKTALCRFTKTNSKGFFYFPTYECGTREIVIQPLSPEMTDYYIELDNPFPVSFSEFHPAQFFIDTVRLHEINDAIINYQLENIYPHSLSEKPEGLNCRASQKFYGEPDFSVEVAKYIELLNVKEIIKEIVPGVITRTKKNQTYITLVFKNMDQVFEMNPLVLVDGIPVFDHGKVLDITPNELERINVLNSRYYVSSVVLNGIIDITTNKGNLSLADFEKPIFRQEFEGLQAKPELVWPDYSTLSLKDNRTPDFRNTLYWNPGVITGKDGKAYIEFYTSDKAGDYTVIAEGFSSDGARIKATTSFTVKSK